MDVVTLAAAPERWAAMLDLFERGWPCFMWRARPSAGVDLHLAMRTHPGHQLLLLDDDTLVGMMQTVPARFQGLPDDGWDRAVREAPTIAPGSHTTVGLAVTIDPDRRGEQLSSVLLREATRRATGQRLIIPVRPNQKSLHPDVTLEAYLQMTRPDGLSIDPWVRTHQRLGATVMGVCERSMTLRAAPDDWDRWCGPRGAEGVHPGLLAPVSADGVYVEPNVWVIHPTE